MSVKIVLVDDHVMLCNGLRQAISQQPGLTVVGEARTGASALKLVKELELDLIVIDVHLPDMNGIEVARQVLNILPFVKVLIFSGDAARPLVDQALQAGACGYILKQGAAGEFLRAVEMIMAGKLYLSPELTAGIIEDYRRGLSDEAELSKPLLSERDKQLLRFLAEGRRNKEIAAQLDVSNKAVEAYRSRLMKKLGCSCSTELVRYAIREGIAVP